LHPLGEREIPGVQVVLERCRDIIFGSKVDGVFVGLVEPPGVGDAEECFNIFFASSIVRPPVRQTNRHTHLSPTTAVWLEENSASAAATATNNAFS
jgi:hypothetical protein